MGLSREQIADRLEEAAEILESQGANRFRVRAYRLGSDAVRELREDPSQILAREGLEGLVRLPRIGDRLARAIDEMSHTGRWVQLERMRGEAEPEELFQWYCQKKSWCPSFPAHLLWRRGKFSLFA